MNNKKLSDILFILWAGGAALLSYSLVYALRKPYTAAAFDGLRTAGQTTSSFCSPMGDALYRQGETG